MPSAYPDHDLLISEQRLIVERVLPVVRARSRQATRRGASSRSCHSGQCTSGTSKHDDDGNSWQATQEQWRSVDSCTIGVASCEMRRTSTHQLIIITTAKTRRGCGVRFAVGRLDDVVRFYITALSPPCSWKENVGAGPRTSASDGAEESAPGEGAGMTTPAPWVAWLRPAAADAAAAASPVPSEPVTLRRRMASSPLECL